MNLLCRFCRFCIMLSKIKRNDAKALSSHTINLISKCFSKSEGFLALTIPNATLEYAPMRPHTCMHTHAYRSATKKFINNINQKINKWRTKVDRVQAVHLEKRKEKRRNNKTAFHTPL